MDRVRFSCPARLFEDSRTICTIYFTTLNKVIRNCSLSLNLINVFIRIAFAFYFYRRIHRKDMKRNTIGVENGRNENKSPSKNKPGTLINTPDYDKRKGFCKYFKEFTSNTSLHGLKYIGESERSVVERLWWSIMVLLSFIACVYLISKVWIKWNQNPVIVSFAENTTPIWNIPFPAITICPMVKVKQSVFNYTDMCKNTEEKNSTENLLKYEIYGVTCTNNCLLSDTKYANESSVELLANMSKGFDDMFWICYFNKEYECKKHFSPIMTEEGLCYTSNMLNADELYRDGISQNKHYHLNHGKKSNGWNIEKGYPKNSNMKLYPARAKGPGIRGGLDMSLINAKNEMDFYCIGVYDGFKVALHSPDTLPTVSENFFWAPLNVDTLVVIKPQMITTSSGLKNYSPARRQCFLPHERELKYFRIYNQDNCKLECHTNYMRAACGCVTLAMPRDESTPVCAVGSSDCIENAMDDLVAYEFLEEESPENETIAEAEKRRQLIDIVKSCNCLPACTSISYEAETSQIDIDWQTLFRIHKFDLNTTTTDLASISFYFSQPQFITSKRSELYGITDFLANCGGLLGVCLGFSILSLIEIIYFFIIRIVCDIRRKINSRRIAA